MLALPEPRLPGGELQIWAPSFEEAAHLTIDGLAEQSRAPQATADKVLRPGSSRRIDVLETPQKALYSLFHHETPNPAFHAPKKSRQPKRQSRRPPSH